MTPKEKAKQLIYAFEAFTDRDNELEFAKQCALIAVDELIKEARFSSEYIEEVFFTTGYYDKQDYWQEVKTEIEKL
jgi:hypothetical protein